MKKYRGYKIKCYPRTFIVRKWFKKYGYTFTKDIPRAVLIVMAKDLIDVLWEIKK